MDNEAGYKSVRLNTCFCIFEKHFYPAPETVTKAIFFQAEVLTQ
jgi:hypothetical protein